MISSRSLPLLVLIILVLAGCRETVVQETVVTETNPGVYSFSLTFHLDVDDRNGAVFSQGWEVSDITPDVVDGGAVLVYFRDQDTWTAMPFTIGLESPDEPVVDYTATFGYAFDDYFVEVFLEASTDDPVVWDELDLIFGGGIPLRVVIIEGVPLSQMNVDVQDYEALEAYFGLDES